MRSEEFSGFVWGDILALRGERIFQRSREKVRKHERESDSVLAWNFALLLSQRNGTGVWMVVDFSIMRGVCFQTQCCDARKSKLGIVVPAEKMAIALRSGNLAFIIYSVAVHFRG